MARPIPTSWISSGLSWITNDLFIIDALLCIIEALRERKLAINKNLPISGSSILHPSFSIQGRPITYDISAGNNRIKNIIGEIDRELGLIVDQSNADWLRDSIASIDGSTTAPLLWTYADMKTAYYPTYDIANIPFISYKLLKFWYDCINSLTVFKVDNWQDSSMIGGRTLSSRTVSSGSYAAASAAWAGTTPVVSNPGVFTNDTSRSNFGTYLRRERGKFYMVIPTTIYSDIYCYGLVTADFGGFDNHSITGLVDGEYHIFSTKTANNDLNRETAYSMSDIDFDTPPNDSAVNNKGYTSLGFSPSSSLVALYDFKVTNGFKFT